MNPEALTQVLDTIAFILVTPEFIGESRLFQIRKVLDNTVLVIVKNVVDETSQTAPASALFGGAFIGGIACVVFIYLGTSSVFVFSFGIMALICLIGLILLGVEKLMVRGILFAIGAVTFFLSRALAIWSQL
jgi:hypothetical protein